jgi:hypothetical protein
MLAVLITCCIVPIQKAHAIDSMQQPNDAAIQAARTDSFAQGFPDRTRAGRRKPAFTGLPEPER